MGTACASDAARERHSVSIGSDITNLGQSHVNSVTTPLWTRSRRFAVCATTSSWVTMIVVNPKSIRMACEHRGDRVACILIEIPRRLVGEEDSGLLDHRPRDGHALLLPTGGFERQGAQRRVVEGNDCPSRRTLVENLGEPGELRRGDGSERQRIRRRRMRTW